MHVYLCECTGQRPTSAIALCLNFWDRVFCQTWISPTFLTGSPARPRYPPVCLFSAEMTNMPLFHASTQIQTQTLTLVQPNWATSWSLTFDEQDYEYTVGPVGSEKQFQKKTSEETFFRNKQFLKID